MDCYSRGIGEPCHGTPLLLNTRSGQLDPVLRRIVELVFLRSAHPELIERCLRESSKMAATMLIVREDVGTQPKDSGQQRVSSKN